jgi:hypothetical protein
MSKKSGARKTDGLRPATPPAAPKPAPPSSAPAGEEQPTYKFWNKSRCPHCGRIDTVAYASHDGVQWRRCLAPICRRTFKVTGEPV